MVEEKFKPFVRDDVNITDNYYELIKTIIMTPLLPFRFLFTFILLVITAIINRLTIIGLDEKDIPKIHSSWRKYILYLQPPMARISWLVSLGCWIKTSGDFNFVDKNGDFCQMMVKTNKKKKKKKC